MSVNGINIKTSTVDATQQTPANTSPTNPDGTNPSTSFFVPPSGRNGSSNVGNSNPSDDYTCGDIKEGIVTKSTDETKIDDWLANNPPTLDQLINSLEKNMAHPELINFDKLKGLYKKAESDLLNLKSVYNDAINSSSLKTSEAETLQNRLELIDSAIIRAEKALSDISGTNSRNTVVYANELRLKKDLNNDNRVGNPSDPKSLYLVHKKDGSTVYYDGVSKRAIPYISAEPASILKGNGLAKIDKSAALNPREGEQVDVFLKLTDSALTTFSKDNIYQAPIDVGVTESFYVALDENGNPKEIYDESTASYKYALYDSWDTTDGLKQNIPADPSKYTQVQVTKMNVRSEDSGLKDANGSPLYNQIFEYLDKDNKIIFKGRIEGMESNKYPSAAITSTGKNYVAASSVGFSIHGNDTRANPVEINTDGFKSTGRHVVDDLAGKLGLTPPGDGVRGDPAFNENINAFSDADPSYQYNGTHDVYVAATDKGDSNNPLLSNKSGIFVRGLRFSNFSGTEYNDVIWTPGVNEYSDEVKANLPENRKPIIKADAFYTNSVNGNGGNNLMVGGKGDNIFLNATFAWIKGGSNDENIVTTPGLKTVYGTDGEPMPKINARVFVHGDGGRLSVDNMDETDKTAAAGGKTPKNANALADPLNDYYEMTEGDISFTVLDDPDLPPAFGSDAYSLEDAAKLMATAAAKIRDELAQVPSIDDLTQVQASIDDVTSVQNEMDREMDSFFGEVSNEINSFGSDVASLYSLTR